MNAKQKTVIAVGVAVIVGMGLYPPVAISCGGYQYGWILPVLLAPEEPECAEKSPNGWTWELATDRLFLQWGLVVVATALLALALNGPNALEWLKDYQGHVPFHKIHSGLRRLEVRSLCGVLGEIR